MTDFPLPPFIDNVAISGRADRYTVVTVDTARILASWRQSLFAFEWLLPDGRIRALNELPEGEQARRASVERALETGDSLEKPVLGIGLLDNVEIGAGRPVFLTLAAHGARALPVHVPKTHAGEFAPYLARPDAARRNESGNLIFYILLTIALMAALSIAVSRGWRGSFDSLSADRQKLLATQIINDGDTLSKAVTQLRLRGVQFSQLRFASPDLAGGYGVYNAAPDNEVFNPAGGGVNYRQPPVDAMVAPADYIFTAANGIEESGTTCTAAGCSDLIAVAGPLKREICIEINKLLDVDPNETTPPSMAHLEIAMLFAGSASYSATIGGGPSSVLLKGKTAGCVTDTGAGADYFYQLLWPQ